MADNKVEYNSIKCSCGHHVTADENKCSNCGRWWPANATTYESRAAELGRLVQSKQHAYGNSFGKSGSIMRVLYPYGIKPEQMDDALAIVRVIDKLFRIATDKTAFGESPWKDIMGYALLGWMRSEDESCRQETSEQ